MHKIGCLIYGLDRPTSGISRYTTNLIAQVAGRSTYHHLQIVGLTAGASKALGRQLNLVPLRRSRLLPYLLTIGQLEIARASNHLQLDLVHDPTGCTPLLLTAAARVTTIHDVIPYIYRQTSATLDWLIYRLWLPCAVRRLDAVITVSEQSKNDIARYLPVDPERIMVIPAASEPQYRCLTEADTRPARSRYNIEFPYILYVGSLSARKNLPRLLEAYADLRKRTTKYHLVIVGVATGRSSPVRETIEGLNLGEHVHFTGFVKEGDLPAIYNGADLFVFPSLYEGFGLPVLEAMACGAPVITSNRSSLPEVTGDAAILVDPFNVEEIAEAMHRVLKDTALAQELRELGLTRAAAFSWARTAQATIAVYEKVLAERENREG